MRERIVLHVEAAAVATVLTRHLHIHRRHIIPHRGAIVAEEEEEEDPEAALGHDGPKQILPFLTLQRKCSHLRQSVRL